MAKLAIGAFFVRFAGRANQRVEGYIHPCCAFPTSDCVVHINYEEAEMKRNVKDMREKSRAMNTVMTALMSAVMGAVASYLTLKTNPQAAASMPAPAMYVSNILLSVLLGIVSAAALPFGKWGRGLANKAHAKPSSVRFTLLNSLPLAAGNTALISLILSFWGVFMARRGVPAEVAAHMPLLLTMWLGSWGTLLAPTLAVSYLLSVLLSPIVARMVGLSDAGAEVGRDAAMDASVKATHGK